MDESEGQNQPGNVLYPPCSAPPQQLPGLNKIINSALSKSVYFFVGFLSCTRQYITTQIKKKKHHPPLPTTTTITSLKTTTRAIIHTTLRRKIYDTTNQLNNQQRKQLRDEGSDVDGLILTPTDHLSPPSTMSRLSDSDTTSDCDIDGMTPGASISSMGSSASPPPLLEVTATTTT